MRKLPYVILMFTGLCLISPESWANKSFVTDTFRISLRRGPSIENKILKFLPSGQPVEVLEVEEGWSRVRPAATDQNGLEGWVLSRYLIARLPWKEQFISSHEKNMQLEKDLADARKMLKEYSSKEKGLTSQVRTYEEALEKSQAEYLKLKADASNYLELKSAHDDLFRRVSELEMDNERLMTAQRNRWFALGAVILLCGLMIGMLFGRQEKKGKGYY